TLTAGVPSLWANAIATFKPASAGGGAVLDPGFYYFNGSGFAGGGGICLNGGELLARDVTLEFVNQAGFSTGTCAAGGGAACAATTCQLGSTACSISACPPNAAADSAGGGSTIDGTVSCGSLSVSAAVGAGTAVGSDYGISTALVEAVLVE